MADMSIPQIALIIGIILVVVVGVGAAIPILSDVIAPATTLTRVTDEQVNVTINGVPGIVTLANTPLDTVILLENNTGDTVLVLNTNYRITNALLSQVNITSYNISETGEILNVTYDFQPPGYSTSSTTRVVLGLIIVLFAIGIMVFVAQSMGFGTRS